MLGILIQNININAENKKGKIYIKFLMQFETRCKISQLFQYGSENLNPKLFNSIIKLESSAGRRKW